jgi:hypothetical protein
MEANRFFELAFDGTLTSNLDGLQQHQQQRKLDEPLHLVREGLRPPGCLDSVFGGSERR